MDGTTEEASKAIAGLSVGSSTTQPEPGAQSKNALNKEMKLKQKEEERRRKEEEKAKKVAAVPSSQAQKSLAADDDDMDPIQYFENRLKALGALKAAGNNPYPHKFHVLMSNNEYLEKYAGQDNAEHLENDEVSLAGRIMSNRASSSKLLFYDLHGDGAKVQVVADLRNSDLSEAEFAKFHGGVKPGDIVGIVGFPGKSKRGELSVFPKSYIVLSPCLHMMPRQKVVPGSDNDSVKKIDAWNRGSGRNPETYILKDQETRYRQRYLDLMLNTETRDVFQTRTKVISYVRQFLDNLEFLEVETPILSMIAGGAAARPFVTHHNELNMKQFMRISPELFLKQLVVGGLNRVYEIGKQFRNEGIDLTHNPEFTTCEFYMAFADYNDLMELTEKMLSGMVKELTGGYKVKYHSNGLENEAIEIDFTPPFRRIDMIEDLEKIANLNIPKDLTSDEANKYLADVCTKFEIKCAPPQTTARLLDKLVGHFLEETCVNPTFIINHPEIMSPLAMWHRSKPGLTERFELFVNKHELCNASTVLNDPVVQRQRFADQLKEVPEKSKDSDGGPWQFVGLLSLFDPPRHDSADTIRRALRLGVNVKMITGDQLAIAKETGRRLGMGTNMYPSASLLGQNKDASIASLPVDELIEKADGFAGVFPEHKYEIVKKLQEKKHIVGLTGDGVNDAPALKKADIGIAVADATDAARSASDIVLTEPGLSVIISAVLTSRAIFQRMKNYTIYAVSITIRIVFGFMLIALIWKFNFSPFMVLIIAILNDGTVMTISKHRVKPSPIPLPDSWKLKEIFATGIVLGSYMALLTVIFFWLMKDTDFFPLGKSHSLHV